MQDAPVLEDSYLRNWFADNRSTTTRAKALFDELSVEQKLWKPAPKVWSVAECFDHLVITADLYHPRIEGALDDLRETPAAEAKPFKARWLQGKFIGTIGPQARRKLKTFKSFQPATSDPDVAGVEQAFLARQDGLGDFIRKADGCDLNAGRVISPLKILRFTLGEAFWLVTAHALRHLLQAQNMRRLEGFPEG